MQVLILSEVSFTRQICQQRVATPTLLSSLLVQKENIRQCKKATYFWQLESAKHGSEIGCRLSIVTGCVNAFRLASLGRGKMDTD